MAHKKFPTRTREKQTVLDPYTEKWLLLEAEAERLTRLCPYWWAAAVSNGKIVLCKTLDELVEVLGDQSPVTPARYLNPHPRKLILAVAA